MYYFSEYTAMIDQNNYCCYKYISHSKMSTSSSVSKNPVKMSHYKISQKEFWFCLSSSKRELRRIKVGDIISCSHHDNISRGRQFSSQSYTVKTSKLAAKVTAVMLWLLVLVSDLPATQGKSSLDDININLNY